MQINGFGKAKAEKFGDEILDAVQSYCDRYGLESRIYEKARNSRKERKEKSASSKIDSKTISFELYKAGKGIDEIAKERNYVTSTIEGHLSYFVGTGELNVNEFMSKEKSSLINNVVVKFGSSSLKVLIDNLPKEISYNEIRMVLAANKITGL